MAFDFNKLKKKLAGLQPDAAMQPMQSAPLAQPTPTFPKIVNQGNINNDAYEAFKKKKLGNRG